MAGKNMVKLGVLVKKKNADGVENIYLALGHKSPKYPEYNTTVELIVKDNNGNVVSRQTDGFVTFEDPRTVPKNLLKLSLVTEEQAEAMLEQASRIPEHIKGELYVKRT